MQKNRILRLAQGAVLCALVFIATWISIPTPPIGNVNLGDCLILVGAWTIGGPWAVVGGALGAVLCDLVGGYAVYAPATLLIKSAMVSIVLLFKALELRTDKNKKMLSVLGVVCAEGVMTLGYFIYEAAVLGYGLAAAANIPLNITQGVVNGLLAFLIYGLLSKNRHSKV